MKLCDDAIRDRITRQIGGLADYCALFGGWKALSQYGYNLSTNVHSTKAEAESETLSFYRDRPHLLYQEREGLDP